MSEPSDPYLEHCSREEAIPADLYAYLPSWGREPDPHAAEEALRGLGYEEVAVHLAPEDEDHPWQIEISDGRLRTGHSPPPMELHTEARGLPAEELQAMEQSARCLQLQMLFGDEPLADFHRALKILHAIAPEAVGLFDEQACRLHGGAWLHAAAQSKVPPRPSSLFTIHAVSDEDAHAIWMHTHGLHRCGTIELEMLDVPRDDVSAMGTLMNTTAAMLMEQGTPPPEDAFAVGKDLMVAWQPWEDHVAGREGLGGPEDRDGYHNLPAGVLLAPKKKTLGMFGSGFQHPAIYRDILNDNPLLYHSRMETERMSLLSKERFVDLRRLERRLRDDEDVRIAAKIGYAVDEDPDQSEHLWFEVHAIDGAQLDATLMNQPYAIARMSAGDRGMHPVDQLSDWTIYTPHGVFNPESIDELIQHLEQGGV